MFDENVVFSPRLSGVPSVMLDPIMVPPMPSMQAVLPSGVLQLQPLPLK